MFFNAQLILALWLFAFAGNVISQTVLVKDIEIKGNRKTKEKVILRALTFKKGDTLSLPMYKETLKINQQNVYNTALFSKVEFNDSLVNNEKVIQITVEERWYIFPTPYLGFEERTISEWWQDKDLDRMVYGGGVYWQNFTGHNDELFVFGQNGYTRRLYLSYKFPFFFPQKKIGMRLGYFYTNRKEVGYGTNSGLLQFARKEGLRMEESHTMSLSFIKQVNPRLEVRAILLFDFYKPSIYLREFTHQYLSATHLTRDHYPTLKVRIAKDERDLHAYPLSGYRYEIESSVSGLKGIVGTAHFAKLLLSFSHHLPISKRFNFAYQNKLMLLAGKQVPFYEKQFLGFDYFIRGYEQYVIDGSFINLAKAEIKFAIIPRRMIHIQKIPVRQFRDFPIGLFLTAFSDAGFVSDDTYNNEDQKLKDQFLFGYGIGLNTLFVYDTQFRFELTRNRLGQTGFFMDTRISFR